MGSFIRGLLPKAGPKGPALVRFLVIKKKLKFHIPTTVNAYESVLEFVLESLLVLCNVHDVPKEKIECTCSIIVYRFCN